MNKILIIFYLFNKICNIYKKIFNMMWIITLYINLNTIK